MSIRFAAPVPGACADSGRFGVRCRAAALAVVDRLAPARPVGLQPFEVRPNPKRRRAALQTGHGQRETIRAPLRARKKGVTPGHTVPRTAISLVNPENPDAAW